ncbi:MULTISPECIES: DegT/DnrJ/EryC1/StrS aminotransferase family protein [unclassified Ensifer]|uniref:DegT/DnrJ/EryC1/StrS family aminotransferase n=1 Tax=unclassified Ensifer TaxID=2633371 RepID=UPI000812EF9C|nr:MULTISPECIES: DegT/DnrJ/EryC1/StrS aminotransferase family protein [unclassified Ensifer]OCP10098.1 aminotransferase [Ensifer sp. LC14]OCP12240.1 aminotransferase [Ensifer sp. LC13]OCP13056.1 aminotransferase [Ensifer sp. LC11]OCP33801.1 aminotransferase [Ensifer sp. LC499]
MTTWPVYDEEQIADVVAVLRSGKVNAWTGPHVATFEEAYARALGRTHAIALANGTLALELALFALGLEAGDEVIVTPRSFVASASCVSFCGGVPVFADVDENSQNISAETIAPKITSRTKGIIAVHLGGFPCDMPAIMALARRAGLWVIEDCAQAHGAEIDGRPVGSFGDIAAFSFCQDKIITTGGEGGLIALDDEALWKKAWSRKDHGKSYDAAFLRQHPPGFRWLHETIGTNWRMTSLAAVLGVRQLERLSGWRAARTRNASILDDVVGRLPALRAPLLPNGFRHAYYRYYVFVRPEALKPGYDRDGIVAAMNAAGIACFTGSCSEVYLEKCFSDLGLSPSERLPVARRLGETSIALLVDPAQSEEAMMRAARLLHDIVSEASRPALGQHAPAGEMEVRA